MKYDLSKFVLAHRSYYSTALSEMKNGRKASHWMWYIFPQLKGLGKSSTSSYYGITDLEEAKDFLNEPILDQIYQKSLLHFLKSNAMMQAKLWENRMI